MREWLEDAVVYQIYPRSFQDSDDDGVGDLRGVVDRLDHLSWLGVDALWLNPFYRSPLADFGYDVSDHAEIDPRLGDGPTFDELVEEAHGRGLRVLLDLVASHTSIEHPWFREHPDWYVWTGGGPPNNWVASFGGPAWSRDPESGRWYLHSFFPEQPDLDWRNPELRRAMCGVVEHWLGRGVDGFRIDAVDRLMKDRELRDDLVGEEPFPLPTHPDAQAFSLTRSRDDPEIEVALAALRSAAGDAALIGEAYLPAPRLGRYLRHLDLVFGFDLMHARWEADEIRAAIEQGTEVGSIAWVTSNHDFSRVASRWGEENARAAAVLLLGLGGCAFLFQGEEIGMVDGPGAGEPLDRFGRDRFRHPMQWEPEPGGGFTRGRPWLPLIDPERRSVAAQRADSGSQMQLVRRLIAARRGLSGPPRTLRAAPGLLAFEREGGGVAINFGEAPAPLPDRWAGGGAVVATTPGALADGLLPAGEGVVIELPR